MTHEPTTFCEVCGDPFDVYREPGNMVCDCCKEVAQEPIELSPTLRVRDYDANQYAIERSSIVQTGVHAGETVWAVVSYCGSVKSLPGIARRHLIEDAVAKARKSAIAAFDVSGLTEKLSALPVKTGKKGDNADG